MKKKIIIMIGSLKKNETKVVKMYMLQLYIVTSYFDNMWPHPQNSICLTGLRLACCSLVSTEYHSLYMQTFLLHTLSLLSLSFVFFHIHSNQIMSCFVSPSNHVSALPGIE